MLAEGVCWEYVSSGSRSWDHFGIGALCAALNVVPSATAMFHLYTPWISIAVILNGLCCGYYTASVWTVRSKESLYASVHEFRLIFIGLLAAGMVHNAWIWMHRLKQKRIATENAKKCIDAALDKAGNLKLSGDELGAIPGSMSADLDIELSLDTSTDIGNQRWGRRREREDDTTWDNGSGLGSADDAAMNTDSGGI